MLTNVPNQSTSTNHNWIPDSGASFRVTGESQNIQQIEPFEVPDQIFIGNSLDNLRDRLFNKMNESHIIDHHKS